VVEVEAPVCQSTGNRPLRHRERSEAITMPRHRDRVVATFLATTTRHRGAET